MKKYARRLSSSRKCGISSVLASYLIGNFHNIQEVNIARKFKWRIRILISILRISVLLHRWEMVILKMKVEVSLPDNLLSVVAKFLCFLIFQTFQHV